jgi:hypothetical protein
MQPNWKRTSSMVHWYTTTNIATQSKLTLDAIRTMHADIYNLPDDTRIVTSPNASNQKIKVLAKISIDDSEPSQQTISPILNLEGTGIHCIDQKAPLVPEQKVLSPGWVTGLEGGNFTWEDVTIKKSNSLPILKG